MRPSEGAILEAGAAEALRGRDRLMDAVPDAAQDHQHGQDIKQKVMLVASSRSGFRPASISLPIENVRH